jgi:hypothetical protein
MRAHAAPAQHPTVAIRDRAANSLATHRTSLRELAQRRPGFEDGLLRGADRRPERDRDLLVRETAQLAHNKRAPLPLWQLPQIREH